jgi:hypothetical protein
VRQIRFKAIPSLELVRQRLQDFEIQLRVGATAATHHVVVACRVGPLVLRDSVVKMGVAHHAQFFEHFQRAVHRGDVDIRKDAYDLLVDLVGRDMTLHLHHRVQDQLALWGHAHAALPERDFQLARRKPLVHLLSTVIYRCAPYHSAMTANDESASEQEHGEILKASSPGREQMQVGMEVVSLDGQRLGTVKKLEQGEFLLNRPMARDLWVPYAAVLATEDYTANMRGPVQPTTVVLEVSSAHIDRQGWRHA